MSTNHELKDAPNRANTPSNIVIRALKGILIGIGAILPGLSGGVLSVIFGVYKPLINFLSNIKNNFIANIKYFLPIFIGALFGVLLFSIAVEAAFGKYAAQFVCLFIGFVIGTFPSLYRQAGKEGRKPFDIGLLVISALIMFALMYFGKDMPEVKPSPLVWFLSGALVSFGALVPGMSPSNFLIYFNLYDKMAAGIAGFDFAMLIPFVAGGIACILLFSKIIHWLFERYYAKMFHIILGLVIGSTLAIFPAIIFPAYTPQGLDMADLTWLQALIFGGAMLIAGIVLSYLFSLLEEHVDKQKD
ncbi:MAG: DUF368 domain-containing protein [Coriobacteriia bacterium]|nr:DUF368 domain-containing protein [Coriobacteriia bacterium]